MLKCRSSFREVEKYVEHLSNIWRQIACESGEDKEILRDKSGI
jgi:hypothetical protein